MARSDQSGQRGAASLGSEAGLQRGHFRRRLRIDLQRFADERRPRQLRRIRFGDAIQQRVGGIAIARVDREQPAQRVARQAERRVRTVRFRAQRHDAILRQQCDCFAQQACFPDAGVADDRQHRATPFVDRVDRIAQQSEFVGAADERVDLQTLTAPRSDLRADVVHEHRCFLALERERSDGADVEQRERLVEHGRVRIDRARRRLRGNARGGVRGIAHRRVRRAGGRTDLGCERVSAIHADLQRQRQPRVGDAAQRAQHHAFVVFVGERHAGAYEEFAAIAVDVDREQRHALGVETVLHRADGDLQRLCEFVSAMLLQKSIGAGETDEGDANHPMFGFGCVREVFAELLRK